MFSRKQNLFARGSILSYANKVITLDDEIAIKKGDTYEIIAGCDKSIETCSKRFSNALNFRGEPFIPGQYKLSCN